jgi:hypothetical protein
VVNTYTYRQAISLAAFIVKDKFMVVSEMMSAVSKGSVEKPSSHPTSSQTHNANKLPGWYRARPGARMSVVDLDGPIENLQPYLGKGRVRRGAINRKR